MRVYACMCVCLCVCAVRSMRPDIVQNSIFHDSSSFEAFFARFVLATAFSSQQQQRQWQPFCLHLTQVYTETHTQSNSHTHSCIYYELEKLRQQKEYDIISKEYFAQFLWPLFLCKIERKLIKNAAQRKFITIFTLISS